MRTLIVALAISLLAGSCLAAGTMKNDSTRELGLKFGESIVRFCYSMGEDNIMDRDELKRLVTVLVEASYMSGENKLNVEDLVDSYITDYNKAYNKAMK